MNLNSQNLKHPNLNRKLQTLKTNNNPKLMNSKVPPCLYFDYLRCLWWKLDEHWELDLLRDRVLGFGDLGSTKP